mgnify:CR=1 FL=1
MKKFLQTFMFLMIASAAVAQVSISGKLVDDTTGEGLIGATIAVEGTNNGTTTDIDGNFSLSVEPGSYVLNFNYTGYADMSKNVDVSADMDLGTMSMEFAAVGLSEVEIVADIAIDRKTPVAVSTISGAQVEALVGNNEYTEILRKTPSVYVTKSGGGFGDSRINLRGFDQRNIAVMINGVPVNDMENGWVYWSNWAGLSDVTSTLQVQRGLGASKLVTPAVGGSINIITDAAAQKKSVKAAATIGNDGFQKYAFVYNTGVNDNGLAVSILASTTRGNGYIDGTAFEAYSYFASVTKQFNKDNALSFTVVGAPQWHHQRFIPGRFDGVTLRNFQDPDNTGAENPAGIKYNWLFGTLDGEEFSWRRNFYHKPKAFLNWYTTLSESVNIKTVAYVSTGNGGGTGPRGRVNDANGNRFYDSSFGFRDANGHVRFDDIVAWNQGNLDVSNFGSDTTGTHQIDADYGGYTTTRSGDGLVRRASMNNHFWTGLRSTLTADLSSNLVLTSGLDLRYYKGEHFRRLENLLGLNAYHSTSNVNNPSNYITDESPAQFGNFYDASYKDGTNNVLAYHNDGLVSWAGVFAQLEYSTDNLSAFLSVTGSNQGFKRIDYFNYLDTDTLQTTEWQNFLGGTGKAGLNYNINDQHNVYVNGGYFSRQPIFDNVFINFRNDINEDVQNQIVTAFEFGYGFRSSNFNADINLYSTDWGNRQFDRTITNDNGEDVQYIFENVGQLHQGLEVEFDYSPMQQLTIKGMASIGNWRYDENFIATGTNLDTSQPEGELTVFSEGLPIGDAAQTTFSIGANYEVTKGLRVYADWYMADGLYALYDVQDQQFLAEGGVIAQLPSYQLVDAGISYRTKIGGANATFRFNMNNVLDEIYVSEMNTNIQDNPDTPENEFYDNRGVFGFGRTWNGGFKIEF